MRGVLMDGMIRVKHALLATLLQRFCFAYLVSSTRLETRILVARA